LVTSNRRYSFRHPINVIDLGLRLTDVEELGLEAEAVSIREDENAIATRLAPFWRNAEAGAGAMLVAYRLAGLSAVGVHYAGVKGQAQMRGFRQAR
jgi:hypothetical protein